MSASRRVGALLCALVLIFHLALFPVRARATLAAGALTAVGFAVTVTAFLNLAGIYPFNPDTGEGLTFPEWTGDALQKLIDLYNVAHATAPLTAQTVKSYALGATIAVANQGWNRLRDFVDWIKTEYAPADNTQGVQFGETVYDSFAIPVFSSLPSFSDLQSRGLSMRNLSNKMMYVGVSSSASGAVVAQYQQSICFAGPYSFSASPTVYYWAVEGSSVNTSSSWVVPNGYHFALVDFVSGATPVNFTPKTFSSRGALCDYFEAYFAEGVPAPSLSGVIADTSTVFTPAAPVANSEFTGMQVAGLGQGATADALEGIIESGVQNREQPVVRQVEIEVQAGTEVDSETGEVTENPVVVTPESVIPTTAELIAPDSFVGMAVEALQTKFPFCLPFDAVRILQAFIVPPEAPVISLTFHEPFTDEDYSVTVDLSPWNEVAAVCRFMWSVLLFVAFSLNVAKMFHIERGTGELFLGNVGSPGG